MTEKQRQNRVRGVWPKKEEKEKEKEKEEENKVVKGEQQKKLLEKKGGSFGGILFRMVVLCAR